MLDETKLPPELEKLLMLDDSGAQDGPAQRMSESDMARTAQEIVADFQASQQPGPVGARRKPGRWVVPTIAAFVAVGSAAAMYRASTSSTQPAPAGTTAPTGATATASPHSNPSEQQPAPVPAAEVDDVLRRANRLRGTGDYRAAERLYARVAESSKAGASGYVASVAAASLRLEQLSDPTGALLLYRQALEANPLGPLRLEIQEGIARAHQQSGSRVAEIEALEALLAEHAQGPAVERARRRLQSLGAGH